MADGFGARARKFMGWYPADEVEDEAQDFDLYEDETTYETEIPQEEISSVVTPLHREDLEVKTTSDLSRIVTVHPTTYSDAKTIGEAFRNGTPVIVNVTDMREEEARRLIDFAAGLTFALHGGFERVTNRVFLLSPATVEVTGDVIGSRRGTLFNQG